GSDAASMRGALAHAVSVSAATAIAAASTKRTGAGRRASRKAANACIPGCRSDLVEDVRDADNLEDQQHDEDDADDAENASGGQLFEVLRERGELRVAQRACARERFGRIDAELLETLADLLAR